ncbi:MAG: sensor histidine kinase [Christensenellales bacterium]
MNTTIISYFNVASDVFSLVLCAIGIFGMALWSKIIGKSVGYVIALFTCNACAVLSNLIGLELKGKAGYAVFIGLHVSNFFEFAFGYALSFAFLLYIYSVLEQRGCKIKTKLPAYVFFAVSIVGLVIGEATKTYFYIDSANMYQRGNLFYISQILAIGEIALNAVYIIVYARYFKRSELAAMCIYVFLPVAALIAQVFFYGIYLLLLSTTIAMVVMFLLMLSVQVHAYYNKEQELLDMRTKIMISQMQPHFLYNALGAIQEMCHGKAPDAEQAVFLFSKYLRENLNSLAQKGTIAFERELEHIQTYLRIEKIRFDDRLVIEYDIKAQDFRVPALSIQPLVENAVKHGVTKKKDGGKIVIKTEETPDSYIISVEDNGVGFDNTRPNSDGKTHIGIENTKARLKAICDGTLAIESQPGKGTTATVTLPKNTLGE